MRRAIVAALTALAILAVGPADAGEAVRVFAAGSLKPALTEVAAAFTRSTGLAVAPTFGPSGLLRDRLQRGEGAEVFASANMDHPQALAASGKAGPVSRFARNRLCVLAQPELRADSLRLFDLLLDPKVRVGTSMPVADPAGDYAWLLFRKADSVRPGAYAALDSKALKLTGTASAPKPPEGRSVYGLVMEARMADLFVTYCTNGLVATGEVPGLAMVLPPDELAVAAEYGLTVIGAGRADLGRSFVAFVLSAEGQSILAHHGFAAP